MASESYSQYLLQWPGVFCFIGMKNDEKGVGAAHHNRYFDIDENVLIKGSVGAATYALEFLKSDIDNSKKPSLSYIDILKKGENWADLKELFDIDPE